MTFEAYQDIYLLRYIVQANTNVNITEYDTRNTTMLYDQLGLPSIPLYFVCARVDTVPFIC